jgi:hypothetical protein
MNISDLAMGIPIAVGIFSLTPTDLPAIVLVRGVVIVPTVAPVFVAGDLICAEVVRVIVVGHTQMPFSPSGDALFGLKRATSLSCWRSLADGLIKNKQ